MGDIGKHFPDNDPEYKGADSIKLLEHVYRLIINRGYKLGNLDAVVLAQAPKLSPYIEQMRENIAKPAGAKSHKSALKLLQKKKNGFYRRRFRYGGSLCTASCRK